MMSNRSFDVINTVVLATNINQNGFAASNTFQLPPLPSDIDHVIVKQMAFYGAAPSGLYFLWSDLTNSHIASLVCEGSQLTNCNISLSLAPNVIPNTITLALRELDIDNTFAATADVGLLSVTLQFIRFAR